MAPHLTHRMTIAGPPQRIFEALTTSKGLASFWTSDSHAEPIVGSVARFGFGREPRLEVKVDELERNRRVRWLALGGSPMPPSWDGTTITWELARTATGGTQLTFTHGGWPDDLPQHELEATDDAWVQILDRLGSYVETGMPAPFVSKTIRPRQR